MAITYNVYQDDEKVKTGISDKTVDITGLAPNTTYKFQVSAQNETGESELSDPIDVKTAPGVPDDPGITATAGDGKVDFTVTLPGNDGGSDITKIDVYCKETSANWGAEPNISITNLTDLTDSITGLTNGTEYTLKAVAINTVGSSAGADSVHVTPTAV